MVRLAVLMILMLQAGATGYACQVVSDMSGRQRFVGAEVPAGILFDRRYEGSLVFYVAQRQDVAVGDAPAAVSRWVVEAQNGHGWRYYKAYLADRLDGQWIPLAAEKDVAFASMLNVEQPGGAGRT